MNSAWTKFIQRLILKSPALQKGTGFETEILKIKPTSENQSIVVWQGDDAAQWARARYLVCEIWHGNDFSAILNLEFYRNENAAATIVTQSGDEAGQANERPRQATKIGVLPYLKTKVIFPLEYLDGQNVFMERFPRQLKGTLQGRRLKAGRHFKGSLAVHSFSGTSFYT
jgi:hypothetical protein